MPQVAEAKQQLEAADVWDLVQCELGMMKFILEALSYIGVGPPPVPISSWPTITGRNPLWQRSVPAH